MSRPALPGDARKLSTADLVAHAHELQARSRDLIACSVQFAHVSGAVFDRASEALQLRARHENDRLAKREREAIRRVLRRR